MSKKAEAWKEYKDAATVDMILEALPKVRMTSFAIFQTWKSFFFCQVAAEVAAPFAQGVGKVTMVSTGRGEVGVAKLTGEMIDIVGRIPELVHKMTGVDISKVSR